MTTTDPQNRIGQLKSRWEAEPSSRVFVQLAEEYRRQGQTSEAISVLQEGLSTQPNYVTAQVALGRCHLESGHAPEAVEVLSRVMEQDPSHPLAGKLLVEAHLETGELEEARRRLDLYRMMADGDPEIESLEERLKDAERRGADRRDSEPEEAKAEAEAQAEEEPPDVFDLGSIELSLPDTSSDLESFADAAPAAELATRPAGLEPARPSSPVDEPFGDLLDGAETWGSGDSVEQIFHFSEPFEPSPAAAPPTLDPPASTASTRADSEAAEPLVEPPPPDLPPPPRPATEQKAQDEREEATVTLGQLYMSQGHDEEAARIFRSILERDPENHISRKALAELEGKRSDASLDAPSEARESHEPPEPPSSAAVAREAAATESVRAESAETDSAGAGETAPDDLVTEGAVGEPRAGKRDTAGITARKISKLEDYLERLRRAAG